MAVFGVEIGCGECRFQPRDFLLGGVDVGLDRLQFARLLVAELARLFRARAGARLWRDDGELRSGADGGRAFLEVVVVIAGVERDHAVAFEGERVRCRRD